MVIIEKSHPFGRLVLLILREEIIEVRAVVAIASEVYKSDDFLQLQSDQTEEVIDVIICYLDDLAIIVQ